MSCTKLNFAGKKIVVTGAGRGLGKLLVKSIYENGGTVFALSKTQEKLDELRKEFPKVKTYTVDLGNYKDTRKVAKKLPPVDGLINNAAQNFPGYMMKIVPEEFRQSLETNVLTPLSLTQVICQKMIENKIRGAVVNVSSVTEKVQVDRQGLYGISKSALGMMGKNFARELGPHKIRVNTVSPALFPSDMSAKALANPKSHMVKATIANTPLGRVGEAREIANAVLFLLHDGSSYITGQSLFVCGGLSA
jgi:L-xylulose reductase